MSEISRSESRSAPHTGLVNSTSSWPGPENTTRLKLLISRELKLVSPNRLWIEGGSSYRIGVQRLRCQMNLSIPDFDSTFLTRPDLLCDLSSRTAKSLSLMSVIFV